MRKTILVFFCLIGSFSGMTQPAFTLAGQITGLAGMKVYLLDFYGERNSLVDSTLTDGKGNFSFSLPSTLAPGLYRINWGKELFIDLLFNRENIAIRTHASAPADSLQVLESLENLFYYTFLKQDRVNQVKLDLIQPVVDYYPDRDPFYFSAVENYEKIQKGQLDFVDSLKGTHPESFAVRILSLFTTPFMPASLSPETRLAYLKQHFFDQADFTDTALLRSNAWPNKAIAYLSLYSNNRLTQKQLEAEFIKAVTVILSAAGSNPDLFKYLLDYLVSGFDKFHFEEVIAYLADNFQDPYSCEDPDKKSALQKKLDTFKKIAIGQPAPDFEVPDPQGGAVKLSGVQSEYTLLIFWSSECGHCTDMLPKVKALYETQQPKRYEVLAISIDTSRTAWMQVVREQKLNWINASDLLGFDGKPADLYNIYATPTMFLLDRGKKILAKPISYRELEAVLREQGLL